MRVLHLYKDYAPVLGGIEGHLRQLAEAQAEQGLDVTVLVTAPAGPTRVGEENGVRVIRAHRHFTPSSTPVSLPMLTWLRRIETDVVHLHLPYPWGELGQLGCGTARGVVATYHSDIVRQRVFGALYAPLGRRVLAACQRILVTSPRYLESSPVLRRVRERCRIVPLGIAPERFRAAAPARLEGLSFPSGSPLVLFVGRLRYYKGLPVLFEAMASTPADLVVVGSGGDERALRRLAARGPAADRIHFLGDVPDARLPAVYRAADLVVLPSIRRSEAFGTVLLEAMAAERPVVSTELGTGTSFVNQDGVTGFVVEPGSPPALARAMRTLIEDGDLRRRMGEAGRRRVEREFHLDRMVAATIAIYREVVG